MKVNIFVKNFATWYKAHWRPATVVLVLGFFAGAVIAATPASGSATVSWTAPTTNTDGSALTDLAGYKVYRGLTAANTAFLANDTASPFEDAGLAPGTYCYTVTSVNALGAESPKPTAVCATIAAPVPKIPNPPNTVGVVIGSVPVPPTTGIRDNPGFYMGSGEVLAYATGSALTAKVDAIKVEIDRYMDEPDSVLRGFHFRVAWEHFEHVKGVYDFTTFDSILAYLHTKYPTKLWSIEIWDVKFANQGTNYIPPYLATEQDAAGGWTTDPNGYATKANIYKQSVMDRWIALNNAFAAKYKSDLTLAKIHTEESSYNFTNASGWSAANEFTQFGRYYDALAAIQVSNGIPVFAEQNYWVSPVDSERLVKLAFDKGLALGGPDTFGRSGYAAHPQDGNYVTWTQLIAIGKTWNGTLWVDGGTDYRTKMRIGFQVEEPELVGYAGSTPGSPYAWPDIYDMSHNVLFNNYTNISVTNVVYGVNSSVFKISDEIVAYIKANASTTRPVVLH